MKAILVRFEQDFMGKTLYDQYVRYIQSDSELMDIQIALYSDPHITNVEFKELKNESNADY